MKKKRFQKVTAAFLAVAMVFLMIPFTTFATFAEEKTELPTIDSTPFMIESINGKTVYNAKTADMTHAFYLRARKTIDNDEKDYMQSGTLTTESTYGFNYNPTSVYYIKPDFAPSCGMLVCVLNYNRDGQDMHTMLVAFKGTDGAEDVFTDLFATDIAPADGYHDGFYGATKDHFERLSSLSFNMENNGETLLFGEFLNKMKSSDNYNMIVTGHSLGAAVANIFTAEFINPALGDKASKSAVAYTYATPLTCSKENNSAPNIFNLINTNDWVPRIGYAVTDSEAIFGMLLAGNVIGGIVGVVTSASATYAALEESYRSGYDFKASAGNYADRYNLFKMENHSIAGAYSSVKQYINQNIDYYLSTFVLYSNYNKENDTYQQIIYDNGRLIVSGSGVLEGNWRDKTLVKFEKVKNSCKSLVFDINCSITEIGDYAFSGMSELINELNLPDTVEKIGNYAFFHCGFTGDLNIPECMRTVGIGSFNGCSGLDSILWETSLPSTDVYWGYGAFANCIYDSEKLNLPYYKMEANENNVFSQYFVEGVDGRISRIFVQPSTMASSIAESTVLPGDTIYYGRMSEDARLHLSNLNFHYFVVSGEIDVLRELDQEIIDNNRVEGVSVDRLGRVSVSESCEPGTTFQVVVLYNTDEEPPYYKQWASFRFTHFTVIERNKDFAGGLGTEERPYLIETTAQLQETVKYENKYFKLIDDINFEGSKISPLGTLKSNLDGNGFSIKNFSISDYSAALFAEIAQGVVVENLNITSAQSEGGLYAAALVVTNRGTIENCSVSDSIVHASQSYDTGRENSIDTIAGGVAAENFGTIQSCHVSNSEITSNSQTVKDQSPARCNAFAGGVVGVNRSQGVLHYLSSSNNRLIQAYAYSIDSSVGLWGTDEGWGFAYSGGILSYNQASSIEYCYSYNNNLQAWVDADNGGSEKKSFVATSDASQTMPGCEEKDAFCCDKVEEITISEEADKKHYYIGDTFNPYGLKVRDNNGDLVNGYTIGGFDSNKSGEQTITIYYKNGYTSEPLTATFKVNVENIIPETVIVHPKDELYNINKSLSMNDFKATVYYNNGTIEVMESLYEDVSAIIKFTAFTASLNEKTQQVIQLNYHYAYITEDGKAAASTSMVAYVAVNVRCECLSKMKINVTEATLSECGYTGDLICTTCNSIIEEGSVIDMLECTEHNYTDWVYFDDTQHYHFCECGAEEYAAHLWDDGIVTIAPTHTSTGIMTYTCTAGACNATKTEVVEPLSEHVFGDWYKLNDSQHQRVCDCGETVELDHAWDAGNIQIPATHLTEGEILHTCTECNATETRIIEKTETHNFGDWTKYDDVQHCHACECGEEEYANHNWDDGEVTVEPTYTSTGVMTFTCNDCSETKTESIPVLKIPEDAPFVIVDSKNAVIGNSVTVNISLKNNPGIASMKLNVEYDRSILTLTNIDYNYEIGGQFQLPQQYGSPVVLNWFNGSANSEGDFTYATLTFEVSADAVVGENTNIKVSYDPEDVYDISETNITFYTEGGTVKIIDYLPGDINGDELVNNKDLTRLFQYLSAWDVEVNEQAIDINGDGEVNNKDLTRLFQYLSNWEVEIY